MSNQSNQNPEKPVCPYCLVELDKMPTRKQKCKSCGNSFVIRTHYLTKKSLILTEDDTTKFEAERDVFYRDMHFTDSIKQITSLNDRDFDAVFVHEKNSLTKKFGIHPASSDIIWGIANKIVMDLIKKNDMGTLSSLYFQMADYLYRCGKNYLPVSQSRFEIELRGYKKSGFGKVEILATTDSCDHCKRFSKKVFTTEQAIADKLLPCRDCTYGVKEGSALGWCRCCYIVHFD